MSSLCGERNPTLAELRAMPDDEIIRQYDALLQFTDERSPISFYLTPDDYLNELHRREQERQTLAMLDYTRGMHRMTLVIVAATIINVILTAALLLR